MAEGAAEAAGTSSGPPSLGVFSSYNSQIMKILIFTHKLKKEKQICALPTGKAQVDKQFLLTTLTPWLS